MDWSDKRPIEEMNFGAEEKDEAKRKEVADRVRELFGICGVKTADEITELGCTGFAAPAPGNPAPMTMETVINLGKFLRIGLAGGGVGLPCFVPPTRYCLLHETIGGLESGQVQQHAELVDRISRELTPEESMRVRIVEHARRAQGESGASAVMAGQDLPQDIISDIGLEAFHPSVDVPTAWKCPEHAKPVWSCRYCAAQAVVEGPLEPAYTVESDAPPKAVMELECEGVTASEIDDYLRTCDEQDVTVARIYVCVATFTRKLSRV